IAALVGVVRTETYCPSERAISPCSCYTAMKRSYIVCSSDTDIDLVAIFRNVSKELTGKEKVFERFVLQHKRVTEIPANVFADIQFREIYEDDQRECPPNTYRGFRRQRRRHH